MTGALMTDACMRYFVFEGQGRCAGSRARVRGETEKAARERLLRADSCPYFDIGAVIVDVTGGRDPDGHSN